jgi:hypothetical protein
MTMAGLKQGWNSQSITYLVVAVIGLVGTWSFNLQTFGGQGFFEGWPGTPGVWSLTVDLLVVATACCIYMVWESRRIGMKYWWLFVFGSFITAIAFTFPLFLAFRERHLSMAKVQKQ